MTPVLQHLLKLPATTTLVKIEQRKGSQKIQEVYYVTEKVSPAEETWEHEEVVEKHAELYEDKVAHLGETIVLLSEVDVLSTTEKPAQSDKTSELRGEISVTETSQRKETRVTKKRVVPKTQETIVTVQKRESDIDREVTTSQDEKTGGEFFVRTMESPTEEITDERRDSTYVRHLPDKVISMQETSVTVKKGREMSIKTESRERRKIDKTEDIESVKDTTKPSPTIISTELKRLKSEKEVTYEESFDHDVEIISASPEEEYSRAEEITEITIERTKVRLEDKPTKVEDETRIKQPDISDSRKDETSVSVKKHELAEQKREKKVKSDETKMGKVAEKPKPEAEVTPKPKESVTDIDLETPKVIKQETETKAEAEHKKKEESKDIRPQRVDTEKIKEDTKPSVPSKPEKKRISPQTAARGI
ncbi:probable serine/threonine-protein kinase kinX isoform X3 [Seriola aureovittata]|uniref:probable serine/threonine-protein kinase kinX isoform X3 n=1 Tax=Seriola aureovittata TaxID=2871759 RepID=UPI0024BDA1EA|nr:probable serine/threonine-protein kinase kinX isoform X3 [Seriola aureovittata]